MIKVKFLIGLFLMPTLSLGVITFSGISEDTSIDKNSFLCSSLDAEGDNSCQNRSANAINFEFDGPKTLQIFNNQQFWVQKKYKEQQLLMARGYRGNDVNDALKGRGWSITGGFLVVITTDSLLTNQIQPKLIPAKEQIKVVAQLWYNGDNLIQLWAQDVALVTDGTSFSIVLSSTDSDISKEIKVSNSLPVSPASTKNFSELQKNFLQELDLEPKNVIKSIYSVAIGSPKNIKVVTA